MSYWLSTCWHLILKLLLVLFRATIPTTYINYSCLLLVSSLIPSLLFVHSATLNSEYHNLLLAIVDDVLIVGCRCLHPLPPSLDLFVTQELQAVFHITSSYANASHTCSVSTYHDNCNNSRVSTLEGTKRMLYYEGTRLGISKISLVTPNGMATHAPAQDAQQPSCAIRGTLLCGAPCERSISKAISAGYRNHIRAGLSLHIHLFFKHDWLGQTHTQLRELPVSVGALEWKSWTLSLPYAQTMSMRDGSLGLQSGTRG